MSEAVRTPLVEMQKKGMVDYSGPTEQKTNAVAQPQTQVKLTDGCNVVHAYGLALWICPFPAGYVHSHGNTSVDGNWMKIAVHTYGLVRWVCKYHMSTRVVNIQSSVL